MLIGKTKKLIEAKRQVVVLNLSNNYKDAAYEAWKEYETFVMDLKREGKINDKDYQKLIDDVNSFQPKFKKK